MSQVPPEPQSWEESPDAETVARELREALAHAKARMKEHREVMRAAGLTTNIDPDVPGV